MHSWSRYHLFAHAGLVLFVCGGLTPQPGAERLAARRRWLGGAWIAGVGMLLLTSAVLLVRGLVHASEGHYPYIELAERSSFSRFAQAGLAVLFAGLWALGSMSAPRPGTSRGGWLAPVLAMNFLLLLVLSQLPRYDGFPDTDSLLLRRQQRVDLERIERVDALCRAQHIGADTARAVLKPFDPEGCYGRVVNGHVLSGWDFLRGSDDPRATAEEARRAVEGW
jgi:hypothetical protein